MKKTSMILFAAALFISFAACSGGSKKSDGTVEEVVETIVDEIAAPQEDYVVPTPAEALKAFSDYAKEYAESFNNITKDPAKFQKLASQMQQKVADMERLKIDFNAKQLKEYEKAMELVTKVNSGGK